MSIHTVYHYTHVLYMKRRGKEREGEREKQRERRGGGGEVEVYLACDLSSSSWSLRDLLSSNSLSMSLDSPSISLFVRTPTSSGLLTLLYS